MSLRDTILKKVQETSPRHLPQYLKERQGPLETGWKATPYEIVQSADKQKVALYENTHIPAGKVKRVGLGRKTRRHRKTRKHSRKQSRKN